MPDLGWDIAETQLVHEKQENNDLHKTPPLQTLVTVIIMLITILEYIHQGNCEKDIASSKKYDHKSQS